MSWPTTLQSCTIIQALRKEQLRRGTQTSNCWGENITTVQDMCFPIDWEGREEKTTGGRCCRSNTAMDKVSFAVWSTDRDVEIYRDISITHPAVKKKTLMLGFFCTRMKMFWLNKREEMTAHEKFTTEIKLDFWKWVSFFKFMFYEWLHSYFQISSWEFDVVNPKLPLPKPNLSEAGTELSSMYSTEPNRSHLVQTISSSFKGP